MDWEHISILFRLNFFDIIVYDSKNLIICKYLIVTRESDNTYDTICKCNNMQYSCVDFTSKQRRVAKLLNCNIIQLIQTSPNLSLLILNFNRSVMEINMAEIYNLSWITRHFAQLSVLFLSLCFLFVNISTRKIFFIKSMVNQRTTLCFMDAYWATNLQVLRTN